MCACEFFFNLHILLNNGMSFLEGHKITFNDMRLSIFLLSCHELQKTIYSQNVQAMCFSKCIQKYPYIFMCKMYKRMTSSLTSAIDTYQKEHDIFHKGVDIRFRIRIMRKNFVILYKYKNLLKKIKVHYTFLLGQEWGL